MKSMLSILILCVAASAVPLAAHDQPDSARAPLTGVLQRTAVRLALAQSAESPGAGTRWEQVRRLEIGHEIRVALDDDRSSRGVFQAADGDSLTLRTDGQEQHILRARIGRVFVARDTHRRRNVLVGLAIGAAASGLATAIHCKGQSSACAEVAPAFFYQMAGAGTLIGALAPARDWEEIFRAEHAGR